MQNAARRVFCQNVSSHIVFVQSQQGTHLGTLKFEIISNHSIAITTRQTLQGKVAQPSFKNNPSNMLS